MSEIERLKEFIAHIASVQDSDGKLASRVLQGMTLAEARRDLADARRKKAERSRQAQMLVRCDFKWDAV